MNQVYLPISVKGIVIENDKIWLRKNERNEWELPGGKLDEGEQLEETVEREVREELGFKVNVLDLVNAYIYEVTEDKRVLIISYLCELIDKVSDFEHEGEAGPAEFQLFSTEEIAHLNMPDFYKQAVYKALQKGYR